MKIISENSENLVVRHYDVLFFIAGLAFMTSGIVSLVRPDLFSDKPPIWLEVVFLAFGAVFVFLSKITTVTFQHVGSKKIASYIWYSLLGKRTHEHDMSTVKQIELIEKSGSKGGSTYSLVFVNSDHGTVDFLDPRSTSESSSSGYSSKHKVGSRVAQFLGIPFEVRRPSTMKEVMSAMKTGMEMMSKMKPGMMNPGEMPEKKD